MRKATQVALLNANYMLKRLEGHYTILFTDKNGLCAHEFILDTRIFGPTSGVEAIDIAKRLHVKNQIIVLNLKLNYFPNNTIGLWVPQSHHVIPSAKHIDD